MVLARESNWVRTTSREGAFVGTGDRAPDTAFEVGRKARLEAVASTSDCVTDCPEEPEHQPDHENNHAE